MSIQKGSDLYRESFTGGLLPDPDLSVAEWSNTHRILSQKGSAEHGPYRIERTPYLKEIAECLSPRSPVQRVVFMKSAQVGASELGFNWIGFIMHACPGPVMMVQPTTELAEKVSKQRIASMIEETPVLSEILPAKSRDAGNTVLLKEFKGGLLAITGANSPVGLRSMPVRFLFMDEVDAYPHDVGGEGDPVGLAEKRTQTYSIRKKIFLNSTPTVKEHSRIEAEYLASDQRRFFVPCPHCGEMQWLQWRQVKWEDDDPNTTKYQCEFCKELIEERYKSEMLANGQWIATSPGDGRTAGFHISALYSPVGWRSWPEIVHEFLESRSDAPRLKQWVNTILGESWEEEYSNRLGTTELMSRAEDYRTGYAPEGVLTLVAGVDVQDNRFAISVYGYGRDEESWVISHQEIHGDPSQPDLWKQLENLLLQPVKHAKFGEMKIRTAAIDSGGHFTHEVYNFTRHHRARQWIAIKGSNQRSRPVISKPSKVDINLRGQALKRGALLYMVGTDTAKSVLYGRLKHNQPGPGYVHFNLDLQPDFYEQLTAERQSVRYVKGFPVKEWTKKPGQRNEALDCAVYGYAALQLILSQYNRKTVWDQLEKSLETHVKIDSNRPDEPKNKRSLAKTPAKKSSFVSNW
jgi:phage terminase large subunit GpA-like protein